MAEESKDSTPSLRRSPETERNSNTSETSPSISGNSPEQSPVTPSRKNKRKSSEPKKRSDIAKKICLEPNGGSERLESMITAENPPDTPETVVSGSTPDPDDRVPASREITPTQSTEIGWYSIPIQGSKVVMPPTMVKSTSKQCLEGTAKGSVEEHDRVSEISFSQPPPPTGVMMMGPPAPEISPSSSYQDTGPYDDDDSPTYLDPLTGRPMKRTRKNYKNMTRERRVEANARERSRVHTISAAFENLRRAVPSYSYNQKLSKLAILRIACSYIMALSKLADVELNKKANNMSFVDCVDLCTQTIQTEGRARRTRH